MIAAVRATSLIRANTIIRDTHKKRLLRLVTGKANLILTSSIKELRLIVGYVRETRHSQLPQRTS